MKVANPQGKGLVPMLEHWHALRPAPAVAKNPGRLLADYCLSSLILSARFAFKPVVGKTYYLYWCRREWRLSLVSPQEWGQGRPGSYACACRLKTDLTWELLAAGDVEQDDDLAQALGSFLRAFVDSVAGAEDIDSALPTYMAHLPYYQRMLATGLSTSLKVSARRAGLSGQSGASLLAAAGPLTLLAAASPR